MIDSIVSIAIVLFLIMDPIGNISSYLHLMEEVKPERRNLVLLREMAIAFTAMLVFNFLGESIFVFLKISNSTLHLASAVILFLVAIKILFPSSNGFRANLPKGEPFVVPLAIPLISGPALLATIMLYADLEPSKIVMCAAIFIATFSALCIFYFASNLQSFFGNKGLLAFEKLIGMILVLIAVQRFIEGIQLFIMNQSLPI